MKTTRIFLSRDSGLRLRRGPDSDTACSTVLAMAPEQAQAIPWQSSQGWCTITPRLVIGKMTSNLTRLHKTFHRIRTFNKMTQLRILPLDAQPTSHFSSSSTIPFCFRVTKIETSQHSPYHQKSTMPSPNHSPSAYGKVAQLKRDRAQAKDTDPTGGRIDRVGSLSLGLDLQEQFLFHLERRSQHENWANPSPPSHPPWVETSSKINHTTRTLRNL